LELSKHTQFVSAGLPLCCSSAGVLVCWCAGLLVCWFAVPTNTPLSIKLVKPAAQGGHFSHILNSGFVSQ
jgi:hypothetical protein